jgi:hypothetical protein
VVDNIAEATCGALDGLGLADVDHVLIDKEAAYMLQYVFTGKCTKPGPVAAAGKENIPKVFQGEQNGWSALRQDTFEAI